MTTIIRSLSEIEDKSNLEIMILGSVLVEKVSAVGKNLEDALKKGRESTFERAASIITKAVNNNYPYTILSDLNKNGADYEPVLFLPSKKEGEGWVAHTINVVRYPITYSCNEENKPSCHLRTPVIISDPNFDIPGYNGKYYSSKEGEGKVEETGCGRGPTEEKAKYNAEIDVRKKIAADIMKINADVVHFTARSNIALISEIFDNRAMGEEVQVTLESKLYNAYCVKKVA